MLDQVISYSVLPVMDISFLCTIYKFLGEWRMRRHDKCLLFYRGLTPYIFQPFLACGAYRRTDTHGRSKAPYTLSVNPYPANVENRVSLLIMPANSVLADGMFL